jgi:hypothetical protein
LNRQGKEKCLAKNIIFFLATLGINVMLKERERERVGGERTI